MTKITTFSSKKCVTKCPTIPDGIKAKCPLNFSFCLSFPFLPSNSNMYYWNHINWYKINPFPSNWNMLYWKWHEYSMSLSPFYFHEYSLVCVHLQHRVATGDNPLSLSSSSHPSLLAFISPLLCLHHGINLLTLAPFGVVLRSSLLSPTYSNGALGFYSHTKRKTKVEFHFTCRSFVSWWKKN